MRSPVEAAFNAPVHKEEYRGRWEDVRHGDDPGVLSCCFQLSPGRKQTADYDGYEDKLRYSVPLWG